jgi:hypothetical protein
VQHTTVVRWENGHPAEWVTETEPEWDSDTRNWAFALADLEADTCPHGHRLSESAYADGNSEIDDWEVAYESCAACAAIEAKQQLQDKDDEQAHKDGRKLRSPNDYPGARLWYARNVNQDN